MFIGIDQLGSHWHIKQHPRKELMEQLYASHAAKMYRDLKDGRTRHIGYIISGLWIEVFKITPFQAPVRHTNLKD